MNKPYLGQSVCTINWCSGDHIHVGYYCIFKRWTQLDIGNQNPDLYFCISSKNVDPNN